MWKKTLRTLDQFYTVSSQEKIKTRHRVVDKMERRVRRSGKRIRNESLGGGGSSLELKLSPQVCQSETISGRVFSLSYK